VPRLERAGLEVVRVQDWSGRLVFADVGAVVYQLKNVPWLVPNFSVDRYLHDLRRLQERLDAEGELVFSARKYLLQARNWGRASRNTVHLSRRARATGSPLPLTRDAH
jgi:hypothetical protein